MITTSFPFDYLKNCIGSFTGRPCGGYFIAIIDTSIAKLKQIYLCESSAIGRRCIISPATTNYGAYEADIKSFDMDNNRILFDNIEFIGSSSNMNSDRTVECPSGGTIERVVSQGIPSYLYLRGYLGPELGSDVFLNGDIELTVTPLHECTSIGVSISAGWIDIVQSHYYPCGYKYISVPGDAPTSISLTLNSTVNGGVGVSKKPIYIWCEIINNPYNPSGSQHISLTINNLHAVDCQGNLYVSENILPFNRNQNCTLTFL